MHPGDRLFGVERQTIAAGKLHLDVRVRLSRIGNREAEEAIDAIERETSTAKIWTTAEVNCIGMAGCEASWAARS